jgi:hypothetical protein
MIQIFNKLVSMGTCLDITIDEFLANLQIDEITYMIALQCTLCKPTLFFKHKPNDICTNVFNIHGRPLWEANTNRQFTLNPYDIVAYCISYLTKVDKYVTHEIQYIFLKCKYEEIETFERINFFGNALFNVQ